MALPARYDNLQASRAVQWTIRCLAIVVSALSLLVLAGWLTGRFGLVQFRPGLAPMQFNTALAMLSLGASLLCYALHYGRAGSVFAIGTIALSFLTLLQYPLGASFGIDRLFFAPPISDRTAFPGRMAPDTALAFILLGVSLLLARRIVWRSLAALLSCLLVFALATLNLLAYFSNAEPLYGWGDYSRMGIPTSAAFLAASLACLILVRRLNPRFVVGRLRWLPTLLLVAGVITTLAMLQLYQGIYFDAQTRNAKRTADILADRLIVRLNYATVAAELLSFASLQGISSVDSTTALLTESSDVVRVVYDFGRNGVDDAGFDVYGPEVRSAVEASIRSRTDSTLARGAPDIGDSFLVEMAPGSSTEGLDHLLILQTVDGHIMAIGLGVTAALTEWIQEISPDLLVQVSRDGKSVFSSDRFSASAALESHSRELQLLGSHWRFSIKPAPEYLATTYSFSRVLLLLIGLSISATLASLLQRFLVRAELSATQAEDLAVTVSDLTRSLQSAPTPLMLFNEGDELVEVSDVWHLATGFDRRDHPRVSEWLARVRAQSEDGSETVSFEALKSYRGVIRLVDARGEQRFWQVASQAMTSSGDARTLYVLVANDITRARSARMELERSNAELDAFAYVASHDLRSPLRAIHSLAGWVLEDAGDVLPEQSRKDLELLVSRVDRMENLLKDLLAYSRITRSDGHPETVDLAALLEEIQDGVASDEGGARLVIANEMPVITAPRAALQRIFGNLVQNAIKHGGRRDVTITVDCETRADDWIFSVADNGSGIPEAYRERVFGMFETLQPRDEVEGSGMGLAFVRKTVEFLGGSIAIETSLAGGACMVFRLPRRVNFKQEASKDV